MPLYTKSLLHLRPTYELIISKVLLSLGASGAIIGIPLYFIKLGLSDSQVGIVAGSVSLLIVLVSFYMPPVMEKFNQRKLLVLSAFVAAICFALFGFAGSILLSIVLLALGQISLNINSSALGVLFKDSTRTKHEFTKDTGFLGSFTNLGWFIGPMLGGFTLSVAGFKGMFLLVGALLLLGGLYVLLFPFKTVVKKRAGIDKKVRANIKFYLSNPQLRIAYLQRFGIDLWWGIVFTFIPIFMLKGGYSNASIGLLVALTQLPLFLFEFKTVGFVEKIGFKRIFILSYASLAVISVLSFLSLESYLPIVLGLVLLSSLALAFLEPISDLFFFSKVSLLEEEKAYPIYVTSSPVGSMISRILPGIALAIFYDQAIFILIAIFMVLIAFRAFYIKE